MIEKSDKRRRQWIPLSVEFAHGSTGTNLRKKFGRDGLLVWVLFLRACKVGWIQGQFVYNSEPDGWTRLGLYGDEPAFTLEEFFQYTGRLHLTSRRRSGEVITTVCRAWDDWNTEIKRDLDAEKKRRKRGGNTGDETGDEEPTLSGTETESDVDFKEPPNPPKGGNGQIALSSKELRQYTGWRRARSRTAEHYVKDPLGRDSPPTSYPNNRPSKAAVMAALAKQETTP